MGVEWSDDLLSLDELVTAHNSRRDGISHRGPDKSSLEYQEKPAFSSMWTDHLNLRIIWRGVHRIIKSNLKPCQYSGRIAYQVIVSEKIVRFGPICRMIRTVQPNICENIGPVSIIEGWTIGSFILQLLPNVYEKLHCCRISKLLGFWSKLFGL